MTLEKVTLKNKLNHLFNDSDLLAIRFMLATGSLLWGAMLLWPGDTFTRPMFSVVRQVMPEIFWAVLFLISGAAGMYSLFYGNVKRSLVWFDSLLGCFLWSSITIGMFMSAFTIGNNATPPAAIAPSVIMALASWWILIRYPLFKK